MSLRLCLRCKRIIDDSQAKWLEDVPFCPRCMTRLRYFGREEAIVSAPPVLASYDEVNPYSEKLTGQVNIDKGAFVPVEVLACEDTLKARPDDKEALEFLAKYFVTERKYARAQIHYFQLAQLYPENVTYHTALAEIFLHRGDYASALPILETVQLLKNGGVDENLAFLLGVTYGGLKNLEKAKHWFSQAKALTKNDAKKKRIARFMLQLTK